MGGKNGWRHPIDLWVLHWREIPISLHTGVIPDFFLLPGIPLATMLVVQMCIELLQHVSLEVLHIRQHIKLLVAHRAFRLMKRPGRRFEGTEIRFRHVAMISGNSALLLKNPRYRSKSQLTGEETAQAYENADFALIAASTTRKTRTAALVG